MSWKSDWLWSIGDRYQHICTAQLGVDIIGRGSERAFPQFELLWPCGMKVKVALKAFRYPRIEGQ